MKVGHSVRLFCVSAFDSVFQQILGLLKMTLPTVAASRRSVQCTSHELSSLTDLEGSSTYAQSLSLLVRIMKPSFKCIAENLFKETLLITWLNVSVFGDSLAKVKFCIGCCLVTLPRWYWFSMSVLDMWPQLSSTLKPLLRTHRQQIGSCTLATPTRLSRLHLVEKSPFLFPR